MKPEELACIAVLRRRDGRGWDAALHPVLRDTHGVTQETPLRLDTLARMVGSLLRELDRHPLPELMLYVHPQDRDIVDAWTFASMLVAHRAERLVQAAELLAGALTALEAGSLQLSAVAARALLELSIVCWDIHQKLLEPWRVVHGSVRRVRAEARSAASLTYRVLWETRMGSRLPGYKAEGYPDAVNIMSRLARLTREFPGARQEYDILCDATHPNMESQATLWRSGARTVQQRRAMTFAPGRSDSPVKVSIIAAVDLSLSLLMPFIGDLWWIAADITNTCDMTPNATTRVLGLPARTSRNERCSCGSGQVTRLCDHPEPQFAFDEEFGWPAIAD